jgi:hypothetical protein
VLVLDGVPQVVVVSHLAAELHVHAGHLHGAAHRDARRNHGCCPLTDRESFSETNSKAHAAVANYSSWRATLYCCCGLDL